jgi:hypothetical protein
MKWTTWFFQKKAEIWQNRRSETDTNSQGHAGKLAYAAKQVVMWRSFEDHASRKFAISQQQ